jgi:transposase
LGKDVTEELEYVPGRFVVNRIIQPRKACTCCEAIVQSPLPSRPIEPGRPEPGLLAHVLISKYADHLPHYRQSQIYARDGVDLDRSTMFDWVGRATALLEPLADLIGRMARQRRIHILRMASWMWTTTPPDAPSSRWPLAGKTGVQTPRQSAFTGRTQLYY